MNQQMIKQLAVAAEAVFAPTSVVVAYAFGSRVSGRPLSASDLDIGYYAAKDSELVQLSIKEEMTLQGQLSERMGMDVDLRNLNDAPLDLRGRVLEEGVRLYSGDEKMRVRIESELLSHYHDYKHAYAEMHRMRLAGFARAGV